jgi:hypothetical protein
MICTVILALVAAAMYFIPSGASKGLLSIFKKDELFKQGVFQPKNKEKFI